jgi:uncharacterized protein (DUF58 family)
VVALVPELKGQASVEVIREWEPARRGRQQLGPVYVRSRYPFGMIERGLQLAPALEVIVWPALGEIHRGKLTRQMQRQQARESTRQRSRPERTAQQEICGLRPYRPGDSTRLIHWRTSARRGELMVREYEDIPPESLTVVFDATTRCTVQELEQALSFTATLCWEWCRHRGERLVLGIQAHVPGVLAGTTGPELGANLLDLLAVVEEGHPRQGEDFVALLGQEVSRGSGVLLVSGGPSHLADRLRRELGMGVLPMTADDLQHLDGYTGPMYLGDLES